MIIKGKYNQAIIYSNTVEKTAIEQIHGVCNMKILKNSKIRIMPDVHAGIGCTIGTTMTINNAIIPNFVGVDIGCGMTIAKLNEKNIDFVKLDDIIHKYIPSGFNIRNTPHQFTDNINLDTLKCNVDLKRSILSIGTLGRGNHFIEIDVDSSGNYYIVVHSGSRNLGNNVCKYYQNLAYLKLTHENSDKVKIIQKLKNENKEYEIEKVLLQLNNHPKIQKKFAYLINDDMKDYLYDMKIVQSYASINRNAMIYEIVTRMNFSINEQFETIHNYIDVDNMILRKGAISAQKNEKVIIPLNMRDGSIIALGKGNIEWNYSAPHGAGRIMSRTQAFKTLNMSEFKKSMSGIYSSTINKSTLDESPNAYKSSNEIISNIKDTVDVIEIIKPIYNFKDDTKRK